MRIIVLGLIPEGEALVSGLLAITKAVVVQPVWCRKLHFGKPYVTRQLRQILPIQHAARVVWNLNV